MIQKQHAPKRKQQTKLSCGNKRKRKFKTCNSRLAIFLSNYSIECVDIVFEARSRRLALSNILKTMEQNVVLHRCHLCSE